MTARLPEPTPHADPALHQGELIAERAIDRLQAGTSDPDALMRVLLRVIADSGALVSPSSLLRGFCAEVQRAIVAGHATE